MRAVAALDTGLMTLTYQRFTVMLLLICGSLFLSGIYNCLRVFWCAVARLSKFEIEQRKNIKFPVVNDDKYQLDAKL